MIKTNNSSLGVINVIRFIVNNASFHNMLVNVIEMRSIFFRITFTIDSAAIVKKLSKRAKDATTWLAFVDFNFAICVGENGLDIIINVVWYLTPWWEVINAFKTVLK